MKTQLQKVEIIPSNKVLDGLKSVSFEHERELFALGLWNPDINTSFKIEPTTDQINQAAAILSEYVGIIRVYRIWYCKRINQWRVVFGS